MRIAARAAGTLVAAGWSVLGLIGSSDFPLLFAVPAAGLFCAIGVWHGVHFTIESEYRWCKRNKPSTGSS